MKVRRSILALTISTLTAVTAVNATTLTRDNGASVGDNQNAYTAGANGGALLQDVQLIQKLQRFARERIPERVVHARGTGVHGEFTATRDISDLTRAAVFTKNETTPVFVRFSTVIHAKGSPETLRDPRGFATKFYTSEGNWDLVGNNLPVFFIRDAIKFPDMVHSLKPSPVTNQQDPNRFFDFFSHVPESTHMLTWVYSDFGTPANLRQMDGWGVHAYKMLDAEGDVSYVKFHWKSQQGIKNLTASEAAEVQAKDFSHATRDMYESIAKGDYPKWDLYLKVLRPSQLESFDYNPLDATKMWLGVKETKVGTMTLNRTPDNFFQETEQAAFSPANIVAGIEPSEDRLLQGRVFSYADTQMYRLGVNHQQLPINRPRVAVNNWNQDGAGNNGNQPSNVNYQPSRIDPRMEDNSARFSEMVVSGHTQQRAIDKKQPFAQAGVLYRSFSKQERANLISNLAGDLSKVMDSNTKHIILSHFYQADEDFGKRLTQAVNGSLETVKKLSK
ncbi:MAG: catalase [Thiotrichaceae bacterium]|nr:catalase [Thiotrichaceae bacterium]MBL1260828.1 catalase [Thiotrichaceae bacterium]